MTNRGLRAGSNVTSKELADGVNPSATPDTESGVADDAKPVEVLQSVSAAKPLLLLRRSAMDSLARREHSYVELQRKLRLKYPDAPHDEIDLQLGRLRDQGLQSDARFVESYVRYRKSRGFAYLHIRSDLLGRGVSESLIERNLFEDDDDWLPMAEALVKKRLQGEADLSFGSKPHLKLLRFLESRGFPPRVTRRALDAKFTR
ncbi:regulatory protein RecX [Gammaproteobacteria bacterium]|nr:regulatory protein RecX [Gammaproteobacteria bacterium]